MPLPQINERIKEVPAQALRAVFAGIGQVLLVADKIRSRAAEQVSGATALTTPPREAPATKPAPEPAAGPTPEPAAGPAPEPAAGPAPEPAAGPVTPPEPAVGPGSARWRSLDETGNVRLISESDEAPADESPAAAESGELPLSNYDALSIASLRARLRVLSAAQVATLLEHETVTQGRPAVITMFERRLAKLAQEEADGGQ